MSAPWEKTHYPHSFAGVGYDSVEVVDVDALPPVRIPAPRRPDVEDLIGFLAGIIEARKDPAYGSLAITDDQRDELAHGLAANLLATYKLVRL